MKPYSLYQTFDNNIPENDIGENEKKKFIEGVNHISQTKKIAMVRLILEYSKLHKESENLPSDENQRIKKYFSYGKLVNTTEEFTETETWELDFDNFEKKLQWILWRFFEMCYHENENI